MADFRAYWDKYGSRVRSETPEIAIELTCPCSAGARMEWMGPSCFQITLTLLPSIILSFNSKPQLAPWITWISER